VFACPHCSAAYVATQRRVSHRSRRENPEFNGFVLAAIEKRIGATNNPVLAVAAETFRYD